MPTQIVSDRPVVYAIGGPNGAGKTTFARQFLPAVGIEQFLNANCIAAGLSPLRPEAMAIPAARLLLKRWRELVAARSNFAFESTFSGRTYAPMLREVRAVGYFVQVCICGCRAPTLPCAVSDGGYLREDTTCRRMTCRRYLLTVRNFFELYLPLSDATLLYWAAQGSPQLVARWSGSTLEILQPEVYERIYQQTFA